MASKTRELIQKGLVYEAPTFLQGSIQYEVIMGSLAYGVSNDQSDMDIYGFAIAPREETFPHLNGYIHGFDDLPNTFEQFQQHHIQDTQALGGKGREYDLTIYSITKYFRLLMACNPNIIDSLFVPDNCVLFSTPMAQRLREKRKLFLHKGCWATFKGYAYGQLHKMASKQPIGKRKAILEQYGFDVKFAYHVVRLLNEVEQILTKGELDLTENREQLKSIRRGEWTLEQIKDYFNQKEKQLEQAYLKSTLPVRPDSKAIKNLLLECLESFYGCLDNVIVETSGDRKLLLEIQSLLNKAGIS